MLNYVTDTKLKEKKMDFILDAGMERENLAVYLQYLEYETVAVVLIT